MISWSLLVELYHLQDYEFLNNAGVVGIFGPGTASLRQQLKFFRF